MTLRNKIKQLKNNKQGFTLVELLLYMGLSIILLVIVSGLFISTLNIRNESIKNSSLEREGRYILARLSRDVYSAQDIIEPANLGDTSTSLQLLIDSELTTYRIENDKLYLIDSSGSQMMSGEDVIVTSFSVTKLGNSGGKSTIELSLTAQSKNVSEGIIESRDYKTVMSVR